MSVSFGLVAVVQASIDAGARPNIGWQFLAYALLTASEVMVSIVALEFAYTQSPRRMKSFVMCFYLGAVAVGNFFTAGVNHFIQIESPAATIEERLQEATKGGESVQASLDHAGYDETLGTADDLTMTYTTGTGLSTAVPGQDVLEEAAARIERWSAENDDRLPRPEEGQRLVEDLLDPWGAPLRYTLENSMACRVSSSGPDRKAKTPWDVGIRLEVREKESEKKSSWADHFQPEEEWLVRRKRELGIDKLEEEASGQAPITRTTFAGGQTKLEGAAYFWFFTWLMLGTAVLFVPYACLYRGKTILQE
jgi:POT family proton-dependent oligopeptide transporter